MTVGIKECSKCEYNLKCTECVLPKQCQDMKVEIEKLQSINADMHESLRLASEVNKDMQAQIKALKEGADNG